MGKHIPNKEFYCGHCQKKYSKKQNWEEHFEAKKSKCYHTKGPRVWAHTLDQAVEKYKHANDPGHIEFSVKQIAKVCFIFLSLIIH